MSYPTIQIRILAQQKIGTTATQDTAMLSSSPIPISKPVIALLAGSASNLFKRSQVALNLDRNPFMQVTLADVSTLGATAQPPGPGMRGGTGYAAGTDGAAHSVKATSIPGRNFIESWPLDLSAFLAGNTSVDLFLGQCCDGVQSGGNRNRVDPRQSASFQQQDGKTGIQADAENATMAADDRCLHRRADGHPAPPGIRHMHISVCVSRPDIQIPGNMPETEQKGESNAGDITMAAREKGPDTAAKLFSKETLERLNPLSITITSESSLPGVRIEASSLQQHVQQNRFALLEKYCKPIYVVCRPFPDDPVSNTLHPRVLWTAFSSQKSRARFAHTSAFLLGRMDRHRLEEWAETFSLSVEVHDRYDVRDGMIRCSTYGGTIMCVGLACRDYKIQRHIAEDLAYVSSLIQLTALSIGKFALAPRPREARVGTPSQRKQNTRMRNDSDEHTRKMPARVFHSFIHP